MDGTKFWIWHAFFQTQKTRENEVPGSYTKQCPHSTFLKGRLSRIFGRFDRLARRVV
jgi:hypothetical protein